MLCNFSDESRCILADGGVSVLQAVEDAREELSCDDLFGQFDGVLCNLCKAGGGLCLQLGISGGDEWNEVANATAVCYDLA